MSLNLLIVICKDEGYLDPSETFLWAHINGLPCNVITLIGNPGYRRVLSNNEYILSRRLIPLGARWLLRRVGLTNAKQQDKRAVVRFIRKHRIDVVLAEYGTSAVSVMGACHDAMVPLIAHFHGWDAYSKYELEQNADQYRKLFRQSAAIIAVSEHMREQLLKLGADPVVTYHNSCGTNIPIDTKAHPEKAEKRFLIVGRLSEKKAPYLSILAFSQVLNRHPDAHLDIIGDGPLKDTCVQLCKGLGITEQVVFHGAQGHDVVARYLMKARCFIQHSVTAPNGDHEGTPVAVLEAMGVGLPVVATRHGGISDVIDDGNNGSLVEEFDVNTMAQKMMQYAEDPALAKSIGSNARKAVLADLTNEKSVQKLWGIVDSVASKKSV